MQNTEVTRSLAKAEQERDATEGEREYLTTQITFLQREVDNLNAQLAQHLAVISDRESQVATSRKEYSSQLAEV